MLKVGIVFGGKSSEHEVSVRSARSIYEALDKNKYEIKLLGVDKRGSWHQISQNWLPVGTEMKSLPTSEKSLMIQEQKVDVMFPIIHGTYGEDGSLQGLFELLDVAYVGAGVLGSAVGMDKDVQKRLLLHAGIQVAKFVVFNHLPFDHLTFNLKYPVFVKPANMGSSVGISKVVSYQFLRKAIKLAFKYDTKVIVEEMVEGREIEVSVLGNDSPVASLLGEIIPVGHDFYDYEAKYLDENGATLQIPAKIPKVQSLMIKEIAIKVFKTLQCSGMARVDMFLKPNGEIVVNEINTLPGFTSISMYPKLWEVSGLSYADLLDKLIELAIERKKEKDRLKRSV